MAGWYLRPPVHSVTRASPGVPERWSASTEKPPATIAIPNSEEDAPAARAVAGGAAHSASRNARTIDRNQSMRSITPWPGGM